MDDIFFYFDLYQSKLIIMMIFNRKNNNPFGIDGLLISTDITKLYYQKLLVKCVV